MGLSWEEGTAGVGGPGKGDGCSSWDAKGPVWVSPLHDTQCPHL